MTAYELRPQGLAGLVLHPQARPPRAVRAQAALVEYPRTDGRALVRTPRSLRSLAATRRKAARMNELAQVVRHELEVTGSGGGEFHDLTGVNELRWQPVFTGFRPNED